MEAKVEVVPETEVEEKEDNRFVPLLNATNSENIGITIMSVLNGIKKLTMLNMMSVKKCC